MKKTKVEEKICVVCEKPISIARQKVIPETVFCKKCSEQNTEPVEYDLDIKDNVE